MEYDVHFSVNGFLRISATSKEEAARYAEIQVESALPDVEALLCTGVGVEIADVVEVVGKSEKMKHTFPSKYRSRTPFPFNGHAKGFRIIARNMPRLVDYLVGNVAAYGKLSSFSRLTRSWYSPSFYHTRKEDNR
jgi:hypothetical protein